MDTQKLNEQLMERIEQNNSDYLNGLLSYDRQDLIDNARKIYRHDQAYELLCNYPLDEPDIRFLLQFQNPLEVVCDRWGRCSLEQGDMDVFGDVILESLQQPEALKLYPLATDTKPKEPLRKFMNVDVIASMQSIMGQVTSSYQNDFEYNKAHILKAAHSGEPDKRSLLWLCRESGTHLHQERDVFIKGTSAHNNIQFYHRDCLSEKAVLYSVEITGMKKGVVRGNLYERDRHGYAELAHRGASPYTDVTLTFISGKELRIPHDEFTYSKQNDLEYDYGKIIEVRHEPEDESVVQGALQREQERRERLPKGRLDTHVQKLADQRIQTEADRITSSIEKLTEPNSPKKAHFMVPLSPYFNQLASTRDMDKLVDKLGGKYPPQAFYFTVPDGEKTPCFFIKPEAVRQSALEHKPSIKEQLAVPPVTGEKPAEKTKDRETR